MSLISDFVSKVQSVYRTGAATEHSYRSALETLLSGLEDDVTAINEPKRVACGAPDFIVQKGDVAIGHVEAKDIGIGLRRMKDANKAQQERYRKALPNLVYTNCLDWDFYRDGELVVSVTIADLIMGIQPIPEKYDTLANLLKDFVAQRPQTIVSPRDLAERMAGKAQLIKDVLHNTLKDNATPKTELVDQYEAFKENLIHDITPEDFADIYAETIAYGMFAARLHDTTLDTFSRQEALELLPKSNPFLRSLFTFVAGYDLDDRIAWIIDDLARVFQACDVAKLMEGFGKLTGQQDPFLHFYESFLAAYNPQKRKARGVWYTPEPVVNFIVRAVDEVLQTEFGLPDGLADTSKVTIDWDTGQRARTKKGDFRKDGTNAIEKRDVHRVQILDPATGTGTFLAEVIKQIAPKVRGVAPGMWPKYIEKDLIPRLHGFELLMASYAMCHMKLDMILTELGYQPTKEPPRLSVYLTNSLEEGEPANQTLPFTQWLSREAKGANTIKRDMPIMCVIGNPPYNPSSKNNSEWIRDKLAEYKRGLRERKINLDDDYIKFLRFSEYLIERNGDGVVAMITNNSYLDGVTQRVMRQHLLQTFDAIYVVNLHGDIRQDGPGVTKDENVFDITQGVAIIVAFKNNKKTENSFAKFRYASVAGRRKAKQKTLSDGSLTTLDFQEFAPAAPNFRFIAGKDAAQAQYEAGFKVNEFFTVYSSGIQTKRDKLCISNDPETLQARISDFERLEEDELREKYHLPKDGRDWTVSNAKKDVLEGQGEVVPFLYKPFDNRFIYYSGKTKGFVAYPRREVMQHIVGKYNVALIVNRQNVRDYFSFATVTVSACCHGTFYLGNRGQDYCCPLYLYPSEQDLDQNRTVNFNSKLWKQLKKLSAHPDYGISDEVAAFDYIFGVLHSPDYRKTYAEFLKLDFPRIPWPTSPEEFWDVSKKGSKLRELHLMEPSALGTTLHPFVGDGDNVVGEPRHEGNKIWINKTQYFDNAPDYAWDIPVGGYQPAQKWLKDRKGQELSYSDVQHYQRILKALTEMDRIMKTIHIKLAA